MALKASLEAVLPFASIELLLAVIFPPGLVVGFPPFAVPIAATEELI